MDQVRELAEIAPAMGRDVTSLARLIVRQWLAEQRQGVAGSDDAPREAPTVHFGHRDRTARARPGRRAD
jgi:hypothetical protein